jgi:Nicastrin
VPRLGVQVSMSSQSYLPPSSLLLWQMALPDVDAVYLGDFDTEFSNKRFWNHNDDGVSEWSAAQVAHSAAVLASGLHSLASVSAPAKLEINLKVRAG